MKIALAPYESRVNDTDFNLSQIERALINADNADLVCFGEAFLQGFSSVTSNYDTDIHIAIDINSKVMNRIKKLSLEYHKAIMTGYIERDNEDIYSSYILIEGGHIIHNYRRISKNWKDYDITNEHYKEGNNTEPFIFHGIEMNIALCGDMWIYPDRFKTNGILIWPIYVNFDLDDSEASAYAIESSIASNNTLLINPISIDPISRGGAFYFNNGKVLKSTKLGIEELLIVDISL